MLFARSNDFRLQTSDGVFLLNFALPVVEIADDFGSVHVWYLHEWRQRIVLKGVLRLTDRFLQHFV
jgi:hypothetical protein